MVVGLQTVSSKLGRSAFALNISGMVICIGYRDGWLFGHDRRSFHAPMIFRHCNMNNLKGGQLPFAAGGVNVCSVLTALTYFGVIVQDH
jgi:hypothetical protein